MTTIRRCIAIANVGLLFLLCIEEPVLAGLGESSESIEGDRQMLQATHTTQQKAGFTVHVLTAPGAVVREYATPTGVIFALAWHHRTGLLNLETLFGPYYQEYAEAVANEALRSRRSHRITTEHLIVERAGRMGAVSGRVWVPPLVPPGLSQDRIQ